MKDIEDFQLAVGEIGMLRGVEYRACDNTGGCVTCDLHSKLCEHNDVKCYGIIFKSVEDGEAAQENNCGYITLTDIHGTKIPVNVRAVAAVAWVDCEYSATRGVNAKVYYIVEGVSLSVTETTETVTELIFNALKASK